MNVCEALLFKKINLYKFLLHGQDYIRTFLNHYKLFHQLDGVHFIFDDAKIGIQRDHMITISFMQNSYRHICFEFFANLKTFFDRIIIFLNILMD